MSLFGSLQVASNTLQAMQIGLQVVSNNIANANTEGFIREQVNYAPAPVQEKGNLTIGLGVRVDSITQKIDEFLGEQLRDATGDRVSADIQNEAYKDLERLLGELSDTDISTALVDFFGRFQDAVNPGSGSAAEARYGTVLEGNKLTRAIGDLDSRALALRDNYDSEIEQSVSQVNSLADEIAKLNVRITQVEGGSSGKSDAGALRAARNNAVSQLTELISATVNEQPSGGLSISVGGEFLVFEGQRREVAIEGGADTGESESRLVFADTGKALELTSGRVQGLTVARDEIVDGFRENLDEFASTLIYEFNRVYSQGQGEQGFSSLVTQYAADDPTVALAEAGLPFEVQNGSFNITVTNRATGDTTPARITIDPTPTVSGDFTSLNDIAAQLDAIEGITASVGIDGKLAIEAASDTTFTFADDTSGFLAAAGLNTFFTGTGASDIATNAELADIRNAGKLALSLSTEEDPLGGNLAHAENLSAFIDKELDVLGGASIVERYSEVVNELAQNSTVAQSVADGLGVFESTLASEFQAVSGVNIDEEAIDLISLQRIYQATARVIQTIQEMLDALVRI
ncbi:MAG: flagellar hook-associated protein FlgK [Planctomycetota bacterium]